MFSDFFFGRGCEIIVKLAIIADDLTGANDTGVQFSKKGISTTVLFSKTELKPSYLSTEVIVLNSDSRAHTSERAYKTVASLSEQLLNLGITNIFKKIDSTMRGNVGQEVEAVMDVFGVKTAFVVPAFPKGGRVTLDGHHFVHGVPLENTDIAKDPSCPVNDGNLPRILNKQTTRQVDLIDINSVKLGREHLLSVMQNIVKDVNSRIVVIDASTDQDLETIVEAVDQIQEQVLMVGSAGIAYHLCHGLNEKTAVDSTVKAHQLPVLVVAGSVNSVTGKQVSNLKMDSEIEEIVISPEKFFMVADKELEVKRAVELGKRLLSQGDVVLSTNRSSEAIGQVKEIQRLQQLSNIEVSQTISDALGEIAGQLIDAQPLSGVVLTGGDIAAATCNVLDGKGIRVIGEIEDGIPYGKLIGGQFDQLPLVTKAGAFGTEKALLKAVKKIKELNNSKKKMNA